MSYHNRFNIASSHGETLNLVVVDSASRAIPSIVTEHAGISDWVDKYSCGIVCGCSVGGLEKGIMEAIEQEEHKYESMKKNCRSLYEEFRPGAIASQLMSCYMQLVEKEDD